MIHWKCSQCHHEWDGADGHRPQDCDWCGSPGVSLGEDLPWKCFWSKDTPEEFLEALAKEIGYDDMGEEGQRIVDAGGQIAGTFPQGMTREQLAEWMRARFGA